MRIKLVVIFSFLFFAVLVRCVPGQTPKHGMASDMKSRVLDQARQSYPNLMEHGLFGFEATVEPNFRLMLASLWKGDSAGFDTLVVILRAATYRVTFDSDGQIRLIHSVMDSRNLIDTSNLYTALENSLQALFSTWSGLMYSPVFAGPDSLFQVHQLANGYEVSYTDSDSKMSGILAKDLRFVTTRMQAGKFKSERHVEFDSDGSVFIIKSITDDYGKDIHVDYTFLHKKVSGFPLPSFAEVKIRDGADFVFAFNNYQLKTR